MKIFITSGLDTAPKNWPRKQTQAIDRVLGKLKIEDFGIEDGTPWIEIPAAEQEKIGDKLTYETRNYLYLHVALAGGDGRRDPIGIANDGVETINVVATLRQAEEIESTILESIAGDFRIILRQNSGAEFSTIKVAMEAGVIQFPFKTTSSMTGLVNILSSDMTEIFSLGEKEYRLKIVGDTQFKVYENFVV
ncbi:MAG: hypothetical protein JEZ12_26165 [Desulfobacterium sp.]|nr:hypothetical protein [Desulfobacterium sp.]